MRQQAEEAADFDTRCALHTASVAAGSLIQAESREEARFRADVADLAGDRWSDSVIRIHMCPKLDEIGGWRWEKTGNVAPLLIAEAEISGDDGRDWRIVLYAGGFMVDHGVQFWTRSDMSHDGRFHDCLEDAVLRFEWLTELALNFADTRCVDIDFDEAETRHRF